MAKKDFDNYFLKIQAQYEEFKKVLEQVSKEANETMTDIDYVDRLKQQIEPLKANYERLMYIKFLLDQPTRKEKQQGYKKRIQKLEKTLSKQNSLEQVAEENKQVLENIKTNNF